MNYTQQIYEIMNNKKEIVLVTAIGTATSTNIILQLKKHTDLYVIGGDINLKEQVATGRDVDEYYQFPSSVDDPEKYLDFVLGFCKEHGVSYYFAVIDEEIAGLSKRRADFEEAGVKLCIPNHDLIMTCHYKDIFYDWVSARFPEIAIKRYKDIQEIKDYPVFIKPIEGRASIGCRRIDNLEEMQDYTSNGFDSSRYIVQEYVEGDVITVDLVRNAFTGQKRQIQRIETLRNSSGCGIAVETIKDEKLTEICDALMEKLDLNGVVNAEFFRKDGRYRLIEVNPRFSAGACFSILAGCNTVLDALNIADRKELSHCEPVIGMKMAKRYEAYVTNG